MYRCLKIELRLVECPKLDCLAISPSPYASGTGEPEMGSGHGLFKGRDRRPHALPSYTTSDERRKLLQKNTMGLRAYQIMRDNQGALALVVVKYLEPRVRWTGIISSSPQISDLPQPPTETGQFFPVTTLRRDAGTHCPIHSSCHVVPPRVLRYRWY